MLQRKELEQPWTGLGHKLAYGTRRRHGRSPSESRRNRCSAANEQFVPNPAALPPWPHGGVEACKRDSGSPLVLKGPDGCVGQQMTAQVGAAHAHAVWSKFPAQPYEEGGGSSKVIMGGRHERLW
jgi:hypothetical protein